VLPTPRSAEGWKNLASVRRALPPGAVEPVDRRAMAALEIVALRDSQVGQFPLIVQPRATPVRTTPASA
jgi:hypothetical protein